MSNETVYSIGEFSKITGLSTDTIRFYEKKELLHPQRGTRRLRQYTLAQVEHVALLLRLKAAGFTLDEVHTYTTYRGRGDKTIPNRVKLMIKKIDELHKKQAAINSSIEYLKEKVVFLNNQQQSR
ncbi:MerR family transcriptional regulator [Levilactobacillus brevis]|uniref:MerR family transcriptional regulator n=1 Tax=Levilactobacillus brevis TaxID=1580 RepID=UPI0020CC8165|nr:MerR family transcriptional regulator [Levilactobacillus brevis]MCP9613180.1 MerR family transcriptional regulator [Levilactobacillus brevis]